MPSARTSALTFLWPRYVQSVGLMREMKARIAAWCPKCQTMFRVDLEAIIQLRGRSYSFIDQRGPCRRYGCDGSAGFMWSPGEGVPFRPLSSDAGDNARMARARTASASPDDDPPPDEPPPHVPPPRAPRGVDPELWAVANERECKRLVRQARG